jgi:hypothetical protein
MGCREEFPHLQQALERFQDRGFTVLAINLEPAQRQAVQPLLAAMRIGFIPLESDWAWAQQHYGVNGTPAAVLLDREQRIVFRPVVHDAATRMVLERQIDALLTRPPDR